MKRYTEEFWDGMVAFAMLLVVILAICGMAGLLGCTVHTEIRPHPFKPSPDLRPAPDEQPEPAPKPRPWRNR